MLEESARDKIRINANVEVYAFPASVTFEGWQKFSKIEKQKYLIDKGHNLVVNVGLTQFAALVAGENTNSATHCGVGAGSSATTAVMTNLETAIVRIATTSRKSRSTGICSVETYFDHNTGNGSWNETALFTASAAGTMYCRRKFASTFTKTTAFGAVVSWTLTFAAVPE